MRLAVLATFLASLGLVNAAAAQTAGQESREDIELVLQFMHEFKRGEADDPQGLARLEAEIASRKLLSAGDLAQVRLGKAAPGMSLFATVALNEPARPYHARVPTDKGPIDMLIYRRFFGLFTYLDFFYFQDRRLAGWKQGDMTKPLRRNLPAYNIAGMTVSVDCEAWSLTEVRCLGRNRQPIPTWQTP
ncbi:hypothetical protein [Blastochloris viridis]|uniref:Uncharacterized protein n=2 Tax=Blastochloris viridis TaxID=1079 RepID=A0A0P0J8U3_BLAVI|nr:hypothetical protein [Blastochloris viridis]ALK10335.1 hypothetical protein BVIR_2570 [Blastochloris viridis]CUU42997.1 hypothetical protein BVIRIDIS_20140 [Blastochloris viridis]